MPGGAGLALSKPGLSKPITPGWGEGRQRLIEVARVESAVLSVSRFGLRPGHP